MVFVYEFRLDRIKSGDDLKIVLFKKCVDGGLADILSMQIFWVLRWIPAHRCFYL